jgi:hypothetical protein
MKVSLPSKEKENKKSRIEGNEALLIHDRLDNQLNGNVDALSSKELTMLLK